MKQTPQEKLIQKRMQSGNLSIDGFLGKDKRHYHEIIEEDLKILSQLGVTQEQIADKLEELTDLAFENPEGLAEPSEGVLIEYKSVRGRMISPFIGQKPARKGMITYSDSKRDISLHWTPLNIVMIRDFGFFEGKGSKNRLEPLAIYKALFSS